MKDEDYRRLKSGADIRGRAIEAEGQPAPLTPQGAERIGYAFALMLAARQKTTPDKLLIAVGHDARQSGPALYQAFIHGLTDADCDVLDCGLCTTPVMFWPAKQGGADGAAMVTASIPGMRTGLSWWAGTVRCPARKSRRFWRRPRTPSRLCGW